MTRVLDWLAFRLCDAAAWLDRPVWQTPTRTEQWVCVRLRQTQTIYPVPGQRYRRVWCGDNRFDMLLLAVSDGWLPGRYV